MILISNCLITGSPVAERREGEPAQPRVRQQGDTMGLFHRMKYIENDGLANVINSISRSFESLREEYMFGSLSQLKREGVDVSRISRDIAPGSELEDALKGFQLASMMGIAWDYIKDARDQLDFDRQLSSHLKAQEGSRAWNYREKYVDCQGNIDTLSKSLAVDVHGLIGFPEPRKEFLIQFQGGAQILIGLCQVATYTACNDDKMARTVRQRIGIP